MKILPGEKSPGGKRFFGKLLESWRNGDLEGSNNGVGKKEESVQWKVHTILSTKDLKLNRWALGNCLWQSRGSRRGGETKSNKDPVGEGTWDGSGLQRGPGLEGLHLLPE